MVQRHRVLPRGLPVEVHQVSVAVGANDEHVKPFGLRQMTDGDLERAVRVGTDTVRGHPRVHSDGVIEPERVLQPPSHTVTLALLVGVHSCRENRLYGLVCENRGQVRTYLLAGRLPNGLFEPPGRASGQK